MAEPSRAKVLAQQLEAREGQPPKRSRTWVTYLGRPGVTVEVPATIPADVVAAEEVLGGGDKPFVQLSFSAKTQGWLAWRALSRHEDEAERPGTEFKVWLETVDQIWDEEAKVVPLAPPQETATATPGLRPVSTVNSLPTPD